MPSKTDSDNTLSPYLVLTMFFAATIHFTVGSNCVQQTEPLGSTMDVYLPVRGSTPSSGVNTSLWHDYKLSAQKLGFETNLYTSVMRENVYLYFIIYPAIVYRQRDVWYN